MSLNPEISTFADAEALLESAWEADRTGTQMPAAAAPAPEPATPADAPQVTPDQPDNTAPDLFADADIDLSNLSPAEELRIRQMQGHFTKKTQELAERQKAYGADPEAAAEALAFVNALQNDPDYALQVHSQLSEALQQAGLTPAQANQAAAQQMQQQVDEVGADDPFEDDSYWQTEQPVGVSPEIQRQLDELQEWKRTQEAEGQRQAYAAQLQATEMAIRQANPRYTDNDIDAIYGLAFAYGGDLAAAESAFKSERNRIITSYLEEKASVPSGTPTSGGPAAPPAGFGGDLNAAHAAAMEHVAELKAQGLL